MTKKYRRGFLQMVAGQQFPLLGRLVLVGGIALSLGACEQANGQSSTATDPGRVPGAPVLDFGKWSVFTKTDPMTDEKITAIQLVAEDAGRASGVMLSVYCSKENAWATVQWNEFLGGTEYSDFELKPITYRIGDGQPVVDDWSVLSDRTTSRITNAPKFMMMVRDADKLVLRVEPYQKNPVTAVFDTKGFKAALLANLPECDWYVRDIQWAEYQERLKKDGETKGKALDKPASQLPFQRWTEDAATK